MRHYKQQGIVDGWYVDADEYGKEDKWIFTAVKETDITGWPDGEHSAEALGPSIQGNPLGLARHVCAPFNIEIPVYDTVSSILDTGPGPGYSHPDGRRMNPRRKIGSPMPRVKSPFRSVP
jgi:hypothetical protein